MRTALTGSQKRFSIRSGERERLTSRQWNEPRFSPWIRRNHDAFQCFKLNHDLNDHSTHQAHAKVKAVFSPSSLHSPVYVPLLQSHECINRINFDPTFRWSLSIKSKQIPKLWVSYSSRLPVESGDGDWISNFSCHWIRLLFTRTLIQCSTVFYGP